MDNRPIGVFDYGPGGLAAVRLLADAFPDETFIFLADDARKISSEPYEKAYKHRLNDARRYADFLVCKDVKAIVIACNLMSAFAGDILKKELKVPTADLLSAGMDTIRNLYGDAEGIRIAVLTTDMAADIDLFTRALTRSFRGLDVFEKGCSELFEFLKEDCCSDEELKRILRNYRWQIGDRPDAVYLACTRFSSVAEEISEQMGGVTVIDPNKALPVIVAKLLAEKGLHTSAGHCCSCTIFTTGDIAKMEEFAGSILGKGISSEVHRVQLMKEL